MKTYADPKRWNKKDSEGTFVIHYYLIFNMMAKWLGFSVVAVTGADNVLAVQAHQTAKAAVTSEKKVYLIF